MIQRSMKWIVLLIIFCFSADQLSGQITFSQKRERDRVYNQGVNQVLNGEFPNASESFSKCLEIDSTFVPALVQRARISIEQGLDGAALFDLDKALSYNNKYGEALFYKGYILFENDTTGTAIDLINQSIQSGYNNPYAYYLRGLGYILEEQPDAALKDFNTAISLKPDFALAYHDRAGIKRERGDLQGALFDYKTATDYDPEFALAFNNMGSVKIIMGDYEGGIRDYTTAIELNPDLYLAYNNRGCARYQMGEYEAALEDFNLALLINGAFDMARLNKATALARQNDYETALDLLDETISGGADDALIYLNRGLIRELTGDKNGACTDWTEALNRGFEKAAEYLEECN